MAKNDNFIHVKIEYDEALQSKRDILASQMDLINMIKSLNKYTILRDIELKLKSKFYREIKKISMNIKLLEVNLPQIKIPKILKYQEEEQKTEIPEREEKSSSVGSNLESQLRDIQNKLRALSY